MGIYFEKQSNVFHLKAKNSSYIFQIVGGTLSHIYWGKKIRANVPSNEVTVGIKDYTVAAASNKDLSLDLLPQEFPNFGEGDFRHPAFEVQLENGSTVSSFKYNNHYIFNGKPKLDGLPATYVESDSEAQTLQIQLVDDVSKLKITLVYTVYEDSNVITRSASFTNESSKKVKLLRALSANVDFDHSNFELLKLSGSWARERFIERSPLTKGTQQIESRRGASSHQQNPFIALLSERADENQGEVYGFSLVYSGNFVAQAEVDHYDKTRVTMGINPFDFAWILHPGDSFQTPEVVLVYSDNGIGEMSRTYHDLYRSRLCRGAYRDRVRPTLLNNWEATYFDFNEEKINDIAEEARNIGIELFVLDDGWFGKRNDSKSSLGDWSVNKEKLPNGLDNLAKSIESNGMEFGLWFEPEMVSPESELYRKHPDWCIQVPNRESSLGRNQLVLDLTREEVKRKIVSMVSDILRSAPIKYVKWDMNRNMTEVGSPKLEPESQRETAHRYILGLYQILEEITQAFPEVLFESCAGGGGRFDPGMLYYMPQTWTSDNTDAISRLKIQYGTSIVYPISTMGAHVSSVPNHQVNRNTPLETRGHVAMAGVFGYELDVSKFTGAQKEMARNQLLFYKANRELLCFGDFYRLIDPFGNTNEAAWMCVSKNKDKAIVFYFHIFGEANPAGKRFKMKGLDAYKDYRVNKEKIYGGDELIHFGLPLPAFKGDYQSKIWELERC